MPLRLLGGVAVGRKEAPRATAAGDLKTHRAGGAPWPAAVTRAPWNLRQSLGVEIHPRGGLSITAGWRGQADERRKKRAAKGGGCKTRSGAGRAGRGRKSGGAAPSAGHPLGARFGRLPVLNRDSHCLRGRKGGSHAWTSYRKEQRKKKTQDNTRVSPVRNGTAIMEHLNDQVDQERPIINAADARKRSSSPPAPQYVIQSKERPRLNVCIVRGRGCRRVSLGSTSGARARHACLQQGVAYAGCVMWYVGCGSLTSEQRRA